MPINQTVKQNSEQQNCATARVSNQSTQICRGNISAPSPLLISISNSAMIYRPIPPQAACTASSNETHWFGCDLKGPDSRAMWKRTYGSLSSSPTFLNNLDRTLSVLSPPRTQQLHCQLKVPSRVGILSVLWREKKTGSPLADCYHAVLSCNFIFSHSWKLLSHV